MIINHGLFYNNFEGLNNDIARFRADPFVAYNEQDGMKVFTGGPQGGIVQTPEGGWYSSIWQRGGEGKSAAEVLPERASQETVAFSSSKKGVVSVSAKGMVKAVAPGKAKITIAAKDGGAKAVLPVQVVK